MNNIAEVMADNSDKGPSATSIQVHCQSRRAVRNLLKLNHMFEQIENAKLDPEALPPFRGLLRPKNFPLFGPRRLSPRLSRP